jgi:hypothetical protein
MCLRGVPRVRRGEGMTDQKMNEFRLARMKAERAQAAGAEPPCEDCPDDPITAASEGDVPIHGDMVLYDVLSGDGRGIRGDSLTWDLEQEGIPILWDRQDGDHTGMVLGRIDTAENTGASVFGAGRLFASDDPEVQAAVARVVELIAENAIGWSIMLDDESVELTIRDPQIEEKDGATVVTMNHGDEQMWVTSGRIRHIALVDTPAFPGARPILGPPPALAAAASIATFPALHFEKWESRTPVPLQTTSDGRFWGHAAGDGCMRNGSNRCEKYQRDPDPTLSNFHTSTATLDNGEVIRVGVLTAAGLHADTKDPARWSVDAARQHHENSSTIYAKVRAWEDSWGRLCVSGSLIPGLDPTFVAQVAGLGLSIEKFYDSRGRRTLCGAHAVPMQAWPVL